MACRGIVFVFVCVCVYCNVIITMLFNSSIVEKLQNIVAPGHNRGVSAVIWAWLVMETMGGVRCGPGNASILICARSGGRTLQTFGRIWRLSWLEAG